MIIYTYTHVRSIIIKNNHRIYSKTLDNKPRNVQRNQMTTKSFVFFFFQTLTQKKNGRVIILCFVMMDVDLSCLFVVTLMPWWQEEQKGSHIIRVPYPTIPQTKRDTETWYSYVPYHTIRTRKDTLSKYICYKILLYGRNPERTNVRYHTSSSLFCVRDVNLQKWSVAALE